jgi:hypothetical protein
MKELRIFPRKTTATPDDAGVRWGTPDLWDEADSVAVSVTFTVDIPRAEQLADEWRRVTSNVRVGGPAYGDPGGDFQPGQFLRRGYVITSRGCPNRCWFCRAWRQEGTIRELPITDGHNLLDNNILACSRPHTEAVFAMLARQQRRPRLTGGLEAARMEDWHVDRLVTMRPDSLWLAYDEPRDWEPLTIAAGKLREAGLIRAAAHRVGAYVLCGYPGDTPRLTDERCAGVARLGIMPQAMLFDRALLTGPDGAAWRRVVWLWSRRHVVGTTMGLLDGREWRETP